MPKAQGTAGIQPVPRYVMPDESAPEYELILEELSQDLRSMIGQSYYYVRQDEYGFALCRILPGGGRVFFHEIVDHREHGISDEDVELSAMMDPHQFGLYGHYHISALVEKKLRALQSLQ